MLIWEKIFWVLSIIILPSIKIWEGRLSDGIRFSSFFVVGLFYIIWAVIVYTRSGYLRFMMERRKNTYKAFIPIVPLFDLGSMYDEIEDGELKVSQEQLNMLRSVKRSFFAGIILVIYDIFIF